MKISKGLLYAIEDFGVLITWIASAIWVVRNGRKHPILALLSLSAIGRKMRSVLKSIDEDDAVTTFYEAVGVEIEKEPEKEAPIMGFH